MNSGYHETGGEDGALWSILMRKISLVLLLMLVFPVFSGMNCQGTNITSQPVEDPTGDPAADPVPIDPNFFISSMGVNDALDRLIINGTFGPEQGVVTCNGITLNIVSWGPSAVVIQQIICDLPREAYGNVQVQVGNRYTNIVQLTKWELKIASKTHVPVSLTSGSSGEHNYDIYTNFIIRACLNNPMGTALPFSKGASISHASTGEFDAHGTITNPGNPNIIPPQPEEKITLSRGPYPLTIVYPGYSTDVKFHATPLGCSAVRGSGGGIAMHYKVFGTYIWTRTYGTSVTISEPQTGYETNAYFSNSDVNFFFDGGFNIVAGSVRALGDPNSTLEWQSAQPSAPPVD